MNMTTSNHHVVSIGQLIEDSFSPTLSVLASDDLEFVASRNNLTFTELLQPFSKLTTDITIRDVDGSYHSIPKFNINFQDYYIDPVQHVTPKLVSNVVSKLGGSTKSSDFIKFRTGRRTDGVEKNHPSETEKESESFNEFEIPSTTPWFDEWLKLHIHSLPVSDHECFRHHMACILAVSSHSSNPLKQFEDLNQKLEKNSREHMYKYPQFISFQANTSSPSTVNKYGSHESLTGTGSGSGGSALLKFFLLVHDETLHENDPPLQQSAQKRALLHFAQMQKTFGPESCHFLKVNSMDSSAPKNSSIGDHWFNMTHKLLNIQLRSESQSSESVEVSHEKSEKDCSSSMIARERFDKLSARQDSKESHPLCELDEDNHGIHGSPSNVSKQSRNFVVSTRLNRETVAKCLSVEDIENIKLFVRQLAIKCFIPYVERHMRQLNDVLLNRKSRSLFSGAKRWFGGGINNSSSPSTNKSSLNLSSSQFNISSSSAVIYAKDAPEVNVKMLADIYFMMKMYRQSQHCYNLIKKDFLSDEAWSFYASCVEMSNYCAMMLNRNASSTYSSNLSDMKSSSSNVSPFSRRQSSSSQSTTSLPSTYSIGGMEEASNRFEFANLRPFSIRCTILDALCLKHVNMFSESSKSMTRIVKESCDLLNGLCLEQASYSYLSSSSTMKNKISCQTRKYAFNIILSAFMFTKCGQRQHAVRAYQQGYEIYRDSGWHLAEDHILFTRGHQSLLLQQNLQAANLFTSLMEREKLQRNKMMTNEMSPLTTQQLCHIRQFFIVLNLLAKESKQPFQISIPHFDVENCVLNLNNNNNCQQQAYEALLRNCPEKDDFHMLEQAVLERVSKREILFLTSTSQKVLTSKSYNQLRPRTSTNSCFALHIPVKNFLHPMTTGLNLVVSDAKLDWQFTEEKSGDIYKSSDEEKEGSFVARSRTHPDVMCCDGTKLRYFQHENKGNESDEKSFLDALKMEMQVGSRVGTLDILSISYSLQLCSHGVTSSTEDIQTKDQNIKIRAFQKLTVRGRRINSTKQQRCTVRYADDYRLSVYVCKDQPSVDVQITVTDPISFGEVTTGHVTLTNRSMRDNALSQAHLVIPRTSGTVVSPNNDGCPSQPSIPVPIKIRSHEYFDVKRLDCKSDVKSRSSMLSDCDKLYPQQSWNIPFKYVLPQCSMVTSHVKMYVYVECVTMEDVRLEHVDQLLGQQTANEYPIPVLPGKSVSSATVTKEGKKSSAISPNGNSPRYAFIEVMVDLNLESREQLTNNIPIFKQFQPMKSIENKINGIREDHDHVLTVNITNARNVLCFCLLSQKCQNLRALHLKSLLSSNAENSNVSSYNFLVKESLNNKVDFNLSFVSNGEIEDCKLQEFIKHISTDDDKLINDESDVSDFIISSLLPYLSYVMSVRRLPTHNRQQREMFLDQSYLIACWKVASSSSNKFGISFSPLLKSLHELPITNPKTSFLTHQQPPNFEHAKDVAAFHSGGCLVTYEYAKRPVAITPIPIFEHDFTRNPCFKLPIDLKCKSPFVSPKKRCEIKFKVNNNPGCGYIWAGCVESKLKNSENSTTKLRLYLCLMYPQIVMTCADDIQCSVVLIGEYDEKCHQPNSPVSITLPVIHFEVRHHKVR